MNKPTAVFAATLFAASVAAVFLLSELRSERKGVTDLQARVTELQTARAAAAAFDTQPQIAEPPISATVTADPEPLAPAVSPSAAQSRAAALATQSSKDMRSNLSNRYPDLAMELRLSPSEAEEFLDLIAAQQAGITLVFEGQSQAGKTPEQARQEIYDRLRQDEREQAAMLGGRYAEWTLYQGKVAARVHIDQLRTLLAIGDNTLTEAQSHALETAMGAVIPQLSREQQDSAMSGPALTGLNSAKRILQNIISMNRRLIIAASSHLAPAQLEQFSAVLEKRVTNQREEVARMERVRQIQARLEVEQ